MRQEITRMEMFKENGWNFQILKGHVDKSKIQTNQPEPLLPTSIQINSDADDEEGKKEIQSNQKQEPLYPLGINPE